jgi:ketosteroid isomerase-like protein
MLKKQMKSSLLTCVVVLIALATSPMYLGAQTTAMTTQERDAIELVRRWFAAWQIGNADEIASFVSDDVQFQGLPTQPVERGRTTLREHVAKLGGAKSINVTQAYAVGGSTGVVVLTRRLLTLSFNGKDVTTPIAAVVEVMNGKIIAWTDFPLEPLGRP